MKRLTLLGALLAAAIRCAGAAEADADGLLPLRGGEGEQSLRKNAFQAAWLVSGPGIADDSRPAEPPKDSAKDAVFPIYLKWKNACRSRCAADDGKPAAAGGDFSQVAPYFGPARPAAGAGWLELLLLSAREGTI